MEISVKAFQTVDRRYGWWYDIKVFGPGTWLRVTGKYFLILPYKVGRGGR